MPSGQLDNRSADPYPEAAATGHRGLCDSDNKHPLLRALRVGIPRWRCQQIWCLVYIWLSSFRPHTAFLRYMLSVYKGVNHQKPPLQPHPNRVTPQVPCLQTPSQWARVSVGEFGVGAGSKHCIHSGRLETHMLENPDGHPAWAWKITLKQNRKPRHFPTRQNLPFWKIYLAAWGLSYGMWGLQFWEVNSQPWHVGSSSLKPGPPALGVWSLGHRTPGKSQGKNSLSPMVPAPEGLPGGSVIKNLPLNAEARVRSLVREDPLETKMATHSSILAWRIPWGEELAECSPWRYRVRHDWVTECTHTHFRGITQNSELIVTQGNFPKRRGPFISSVRMRFGRRPC